MYIPICFTVDLIVNLIFNSKSIKLDELEQTLNEAKHIPVYMENVEKLEKLVNEASKSQNSADLLLKDPKYPYLSDLIETHKKTKDLPLRSNSTDAISVRINMAKDWLTRLGHFYLKPDVMYLIQHGGGLADPLNVPLLEALTPRLDLKSLISKIQASLLNHQSGGVPSESASANVSPSSTNLSKRQRAKVVNTSHAEHLVYFIESISDLYKDKNFLTLSEKYKALEIKELELIKQLRKLNIERIVLIKNQIQSEIENVARSETPISETSETKLNGANFRCCSCTKSILASVYAKTFQQCRLCLGLFHTNCKLPMSGKHDWHGLGRHSKYTQHVDRDCYLLCQGCERTKRPSLDPIASMLVHFENLEVRSYEANALQMNFDRVLKWQEKFKHLCDDLNVKNLFELARRYFSDRPNSAKTLSEINSELSMFEKLFYSFWRKIAISL